MALKSVLDHRDRRHALWRQLEWRFAVHTWREPLRQHDAAEFFSYVAPKVCLSSLFDGEWSERTQAEDSIVDCECRSLAFGRLHATRCATSNSSVALPSSYSCALQATSAPRVTLCTGGGRSTEGHKCYSLGSQVEHASLHRPMAGIRKRVLPCLRSCTPPGIRHASRALHQLLANRSTALVL